MVEDPTNSEGTPPTPAPEFRYADDATVPIELRGKTAREVSELFAALTASGMVAPAPAPSPPPPTNGGYASATDLQQLAAQQASVTFNLARQEHADSFKRWAPEIAEVLQRIPQPQWTLDAITSAVQLVKGRHVDELVAEKVRAATTHSLVGMRSNGNGAHATPNYAPQRPEPPLEGVPGEWLKHAEQAGITDREVAEFERANDLEPGEFLKQFGGRYITDAIADVNPGRRKA